MGFQEASDPDESGWCYQAIHGWNNVATWKENFTHINGKPGGFIYDVDASLFEKVSSEEYVSRQNLTPLQTRFVSIDDVMQKGVQLFLFQDTATLQTFQRLNQAGQRFNAMRLLCTESFDKIIWLNKLEDITPQMFHPWQNKENILQTKCRL